MRTGLVCFFLLPKPVFGFGLPSPLIIRYLSLRGLVHCVGQRGCNQPGAKTRLSQEGMGAVHGGRLLLSALEV